VTRVLFLSVSILVLKLINNSSILNKGNLVWISDLNKPKFLRFYFSVVSIVLDSKDKIYQTLKTCLTAFTKHLEVGQKYSAAHRLELEPSPRCLEMWPNTVFDVLHLTWRCKCVLEVPWLYVILSFIYKRWRYITLFFFNASQPVRKSTVHNVWRILLGLHLTSVMQTLNIDLARTRATSSIPHGSDLRWSRTVLASNLKTMVKTLMDTQLHQNSGSHVKKIAVIIGESWTSNNSGRRLFVTFYYNGDPEVNAK